MRRRLGVLPFLALAAAGLWGSAVGVIELRHAVSRAQALYQLDTVGSQIESDLEFQTQESRRAFLYALALIDPNEQLPFVDAAREAGRAVHDTLENFRRLNPPESIARSLRDFQKSWDSYTQTRDAVVAAILTGELKQAAELDQRAGNQAFTAALGHLHAVKQALHVHAKEESERLDRTLIKCIAGLAFFVFAAAAGIFALLRINRARAAVARELRATNRELERAQDLDRRRVAILEMVGRHAPLSESLAAIAELPAWCQPGAGAALWSAGGDKLLYQVSSGLPQRVTNALRSRAFERSEGHLVLGREEERYIEVLADSYGFNCARIPLRNIAGDDVGLLLTFVPTTVEVKSHTVCTQMAQMATLAIENTLIYERLAFQAQHDVLTGLPNRLLFQDRVQQAILRAQRNRKKVAVLWFDLDRFKQINDTLGHRVGDELLCEVSRRLRASLRESDTAARIGGDELVVLAADLEDRADVEIIAHKIQRSLRAPLVISGHDIKVTASVGISLFPEDGSDPANLMRNADLAMYQAKRQGRDRFQIFHRELGDSLGRRLEIEQELRSAIESGEFHMEYQPLIGRHDELEGFEALLRWNNRKLGKVSPAEFIPIAEEAGLILRIGEWVTRTVCRTGAEWLAAEIDVPRIAINASGLQFTDPQFASMIHNVLEETGFPAGKLEIEVTETALVGNLDSAIAQIARLRGLGITFAIDDFGTGYSSLNQLRTLPVDFVKVDRSFIKDLERMAGDSATLVRGIIGLAHNLRLTVVAEGVETEKQLSILRSLGCDLSQGFYLHRPLTVEAAEELMRKHAKVATQESLSEGETIPA